MRSVFSLITTAIGAMLISVPIAAQQILLVSPELPTSADSIRINASRPGCDYTYSTAITSMTITLTATKTTGCPPIAPPDPFRVVEFLFPPLAAGSYNVVMITDGKATDSRAFVVQTPASQLSLLQGRFTIAATWTDPNSGAERSAAAVSLGDASGYFWFFSPENVDLTIKMLGPDPLSLHYWFFASSGTNVALALTVTDTWASNKTVTYHTNADENHNIFDFSSFSYLPTQ
ncbi:MAG: hypothetical protein JOZ15_01345 [Acidobacteria bacterium]|nr:hypothetical protein [Acidobacteriota bacterium]